MYYTMLNSCATMAATADKPSDDSLYAIAGRTTLAPGVTNAGSLYAISASTGETLWKFDQRAGMLSLLSTGSGLLFGGDANGRFRAFDQKTGKVLWEMNLGASVTGYPITYTVNGKQYLAVSTSRPNAQMLSLTPELRVANSNQMFVFALPDR
jgi:alcohol dehydrogenase (cytochrome c)